MYCQDCFSNNFKTEVRYLIHQGLPRGGGVGQAGSSKISWQESLTFWNNCSRHLWVELSITEGSSLQANPPNSQILKLL